MIPLVSPLPQAPGPCFETEKAILIRSTRSSLHRQSLRRALSLSDRFRLLLDSFRHFSHPFLGAFHLSFAVLLRYRSRVIFRFGSWYLPSSHGITIPRYSGYSPYAFWYTITGLSPSMVPLSSGIYLTQLRRDTSPHSTSP